MFFEVYHPFRLAKLAGRYWLVSHEFNLYGQFVCMLLQSLEFIAEMKIKNRGTKSFPWGKN